MTRSDAMQIILKEDLRNYNLNEERSNKENEVTIKKCNDKWIVYATDERASKIAGSEVWISAFGKQKEFLRAKVFMAVMQAYCRERKIEF